MRERKLFFEKNLTFSNCIPAVGQNNRQKWGTFNEKRRKKIRQLKKANPLWHSVVTDQIKLALQCRNIRNIERDLQDINKLLEFELNLYCVEEITWIRKIRRGLLKSLQKWKKDNLLLTVTLNEGKFYLAQFYLKTIFNSSVIILFKIKQCLQPYLNQSHRLLLHKCN